MGCRSWAVVPAAATVAGDPQQRHVFPSSAACVRPATPWTAARGGGPRRAWDGGGGSLGSARRFGSVEGTSPRPTPRPGGPPRTGGVAAGVGTHREDAGGPRLGTSLVRARRVGREELKRKRKPAFTRRYPLVDVLCWTGVLRNGWRRPAPAVRASPASARRVGRVSFGGGARTYQSPPPTAVHAQHPRQSSPCHCQEEFLSPPLLDGDVERRKVMGRLRGWQAVARGRAQTRTSPSRHMRTE